MTISFTFKFVLGIITTSENRDQTIYLEDSYHLLQYRKMIQIFHGAFQYEQ